MIQKSKALGFQVILLDGRRIFCTRLELLPNSQNVTLLSADDFKVVSVEKVFAVEVEWGEG